MIDVSSMWNAASALLITSLTGPVTVRDVQAWRLGLHAVEDKLPEGVAFRLLLNLHGFAPADLDAHREMRTVVPLLLARHGMRPAFLDLFDERPELPITLHRQVRCVAFANVHHDAAKMASYEARIGRAQQRFFTDRQSAEAWLMRRALPVPDVT